MFSLTADAASPSLPPMLCAIGRVTRSSVANSLSSGLPRTSSVKEGLPLGVYLLAIPRPSHDRRKSFVFPQKSQSMIQSPPLKANFGGQCLMSECHQESNSSGLVSVCYSPWGHCLLLPSTFPRVSNKATSPQGHWDTTFPSLRPLKISIQQRSGNDGIGCCLARGPAFLAQ